MVTLPAEGAWPHGWFPGLWRATSADAEIPAQQPDYTPAVVRHFRGQPMMAPGDPIQENAQADKTAAMVHGFLAGQPGLVSPASIETLSSALTGPQRAPFILHAGPCAEMFADQDGQGPSSASGLVECRATPESGCGSCRTGECPVAYAQHLNRVSDAFVAMSPGHSDAGVVRIWRGAGQYGKPRSSCFEQSPLTGERILSYRGDMINSDAPCGAARSHDPRRLVRAHEAARGALDRLGAHGYLWSPNDADSHQAIFTSHEALVLSYEESQTRVEQWASGGQLAAAYATSGHLVWVGDRTRDHPGTGPRQPSGHLLWAQGVRNPLGIKLSARVSPEALVFAIRSGLGCEQLFRPAPGVAASSQANDPLPGRAVLIIARYGARAAPRAVGQHIRILRAAGLMPGDSGPMDGDGRIFAQAHAAAAAVLGAGPRTNLLGDAPSGAFGELLGGAFRGWAPSGREVADIARVAAHRAGELCAVPDAALEVDALLGRALPRGTSLAAWPAPLLRALGQHVDEVARAAVAAARENLADSAEEAPLESPDPWLLPCRCRSCARARVHWLADPMHGNTVSISPRVDPGVLAPMSDPATAGEAVRWAVGPGSPSAPSSPMELPLAEEPAPQAGVPTAACRGCAPPPDTFRPKTRHLRALAAEVCAQHIGLGPGASLGGLHMEVAPRQVSECVDDTNEQNTAAAVFSQAWRAAARHGSQSCVACNGQASPYLTACDPRLSAGQSVFLAEMTARLLSLGPLAR
ncbi:hypothetical protein H696_01550 [Fonticula alba]|uniref:Phospho-2-dehydro-3-deoxyheptonate aldolase n=1 Tax=Fonticula alba TaxID=691883 RepID=A0A058ZDW4_FONAL|nr:hypothetical protein H696_01550 [Fonticula alba]KCV72146.1 hypothetical protein H696_01550 [Fonticula alba]|eukprot:XP_009493724.1 hypothetical protein H696_01550 [Fonticula alba]